MNRNVFDDILTCAMVGLSVSVCGVIVFFFTMYMAGEMKIANNYDDFMETCQTNEITFDEVKLSVSKASTEPATAYINFYDNGKRIFNTTDLSNLTNGLLIVEICGGEEYNNRNTIKEVRFK